MTYRDTHPTPVTRVKLVEHVMAGPRPKWPARYASLTRPSPSGYGSSATAVLAPCTNGRAVLTAAPADPASAGSSHLRCTPRARLRTAPHRLGLHIARGSVYGVLRRARHDRLALLH